MEAALRTAYNLVTGKNPEPDAFEVVRGLGDGPWKEATFDVGGTEVKTATVHGLGNARKLEAIKHGDAAYDFVEVMACPGGCVGGGGQPIHDGVEMAAGQKNYISLIRTSRYVSAIAILRSIPFTRNTLENRCHLCHTIFFTRTTSTARLTSSSSKNRIKMISRRLRHGDCSLFYVAKYSEIGYNLLQSGLNFTAG